MTVVKGPLGEIGDIDPSRLQEALAGGWTVATPEEIEKQEYGGVGGKAAALGAGVVSGLTAGLSNVALRQIAPAAADYVAKATRVSPGLAMAAEAAGLGLGVLYGAGEAGLAAKVVSGPTRAITALGEMAAGAAGESAIARAAIRAGTEGAIYGAGSALSEASLNENYDHLGEKLLANAGLGAVTGAGIAGVLEGVVPVVARKMGLGVEPTISKETRTIREAIGDKIEQVFPEMTPELKYAEELKRGIRTATDVDARAREVAKAYDELFDVDKVMRKGMFGEAKIKQMDKLVDHEKWAAALEVASQAAGEAKLTQQFLEELADKGGNAAHVSRMAKQMKMLEDTIAGIEDVPVDKRALELFTAVDKYKRGLGDAADYGYLYPRSEAAKSYDKLYKGTADMVGIQQALENPVWGRAADAQREINAIVSNKLQLQREFSKAFATPFGKEEGYLVERLDPGTYKSLLTEINGAQHDLKWEASDHVLRGMKEQADMALKHYAWSPSEVAQLESVATKVDAVQAMVAADKAEAALASKIERIRMLEGDQGLFEKMVRSIPFAGPALGEASDLLTKPLKRAEIIAQIKGKSATIDELIDKGIAAQLSGDLKAPALTGAAKIDVEKIAEPYASAAPTVGTALAMAAERAAAFIGQRAVQGHPNFGINDKDYTTPAETAKYARYYRGAIDPVGVLREPLTREHVEAIKAVYPNLYNQMVASAMAQASRRTLSLRERAALSVLLDRPVDWSTHGAFIAEVQSAYPAAQPAPISGKRMKLKGYATGAQRLEGR